MRSTPSLKTGTRWLPELLKQRAEAGETEMDYESAADTIIALMINHLMAKLGVSSPHLSDPQKRRARG